MLQKLQDLVVFRFRLGRGIKKDQNLSIGTAAWAVIPCPDETHRIAPSFARSGTRNRKPGLYRRFGTAEIPFKKSAKHCLELRHDALLFLLFVWGGTALVLPLFPAQVNWW